MDKFLKECFLQKTNQFGALKLLHEKNEKLELGAELTLDIDNAIEQGKQWVVAKCEADADEEAIIGVFSEEDSKDIKLYLDAGWKKDLFLCRISRYNADADENKRFSVAIHIKKGPDADVQKQPAQAEQS